MGVTNSNKELNLTTIKCGEAFKIKLSLNAEPDIITNPTDIVMILDRSGSMKGIPLDNLKKGAKTFIDIIAESTGGTQTGQIGYDSRIGIVSFAEEATQNTQLITDVEDLKDAVDSLVANGETNHKDAFTKALALFDPNSNNAKVMIMFTDGKTTTGGDPNPTATEAKNQGVIIYCIGLVGQGGIDEQALNDWASSPSSSYVSIVPTAEDLEKLFEDLAKNITKPGATNIIITDKIKPCFMVNSIISPTKGTASILDSTTVQWKIDELGVTQNEGAVLEFVVQHIGTCNGAVEVNESIDYEDDEDNIVTFPSPSIDIDCGTIVYPEECPYSIDFDITNCNDVIEYDAGDLYLESQGRILQLDIKLKQICPNKRVALAVILNELDDQGIEHKRGLKTMTIPAHLRQTCQDIMIRCVKFVLPEDEYLLDNQNTLCRKRCFKTRFIAHYIDNDYSCCNEE